jgi:hypothetical protein
MHGAGGAGIRTCTGLNRLSFAPILLATKIPLSIRYAAGQAHQQISAGVG